MFTEFQLTVGAVSRVLDAAIIGLVWLASFWLRFYLPVIEVTKGFPPFATYAALTPLIVVLWAIVFSAQGIYRPQRTLHSGSEAVKLLKSHCAALLCFVAITYVFSEYRYSRGVMAYFGLLGGVALVASRLSMRAMFRALRRHGYRTRNVLLIGQGPSLENLIDRITRFPELGLETVGVLVPDGSDVTAVGGCRALGHFGDVRRVVRETRRTQGFDRAAAAAVGRAGAHPRIRSRTRRSTSRSSPTCTSTSRSVARSRTSTACPS